MHTDASALPGEKPAYVLFDLDNTLYEYLPSHTAALEAVRIKSHRSLGTDGKSFDREFEKAKQSTKRELGKTAASHSRLLYFQKFIENTAGETNPQLALEFEQTYWRAFLLCAKLFPGARELIDFLRFKKIPIGLVTDLTAQIQFRKLVYFELDHLFDTIVTSEEAGVEKPNPTIFEMARDKLGFGVQDRAWMIGDDFEKDILGAMNAVNAIGIQKIHTGVVRSDDALVHFGAYDDLIKLIKKRID